MTDPDAYRLGDAEALRIFNDLILPDQLSGIPSQAKPVVVFVVAQHGSGKTATTNGIMSALNKRGGSVVLDNDVYKPYHPQFRELMSRDGEFATLATAADGQRWGRMAAEYVRANRFDALIEETVQNPPYFREQAQAWRAAGYRVEVALMAVPEPVSRLGVLDRYQKQVEDKGAGRLPADHKQQLAYAGVAEVAAMVDREKLADSVSVWNRGYEAVYFNQLGPDGEWAHPAGTVEALAKERQRQRTVPESDDFRRVHGRLSGVMEPRFRPQLDTIKEQALPLLTANRVPGMRLSDADLGHALTSAGHRAAIESGRADQQARHFAAERTRAIAGEGPSATALRVAGQHDADARAAAIKEDIGAIDRRHQIAAEVVRETKEREDAAVAEYSAEADRRAQLSAEQAASESTQRQAQRSSPDREAEPS